MKRNQRKNEPEDDQMKTNFRSVTAFTIAAVFLCSMPLLADSGGGGGGTEESNSINMTYVALGLALLVGGYLIYDAIADAGDDVEAATDSIGIIDTGVDWDRALNTATGQVSLAVSVLPGSHGRQRAVELIRTLREMTGENVHIYEDPVDLGQGPETERAALAREFFGTDYLIFQTAQEDSLLRFGIASRDSVLWTSQDQTGNSMVVVVTNILGSGVF
jgi:hypothetical protein